MDKNGSAITVNTAISNLSLGVAQLLNLIVIDQLDGDSLTNALKTLNISFTGESDGNSIIS